MAPVSLAIFVVLSLLSFSFTYDIAFFSATLPSQLPAIVTLLLVSQRCSVQATPSNSRMLHMLHRQTSMVLALAATAHRVAHAAYVEVTAKDIANTRYKDTPVSIIGNNIVIELKKNGLVNDVYFAFNGDYQFRIEKCPGEPARISVEGHKCKWGFDWNDDYCVVRPNHVMWNIQFPEPKRGKIQDLLFRYVKEDERIACEDRPGHPLDSKNIQDLCMWTSASQGGYNVSAITITNEQPNCPVKVTIINAVLFTAVPDTSTTASTAASTATSSEDDGSLKTWHIVCIAVGGVLLLLLIVFCIGMLVFFVRRRRGKGGASPVPDPRFRSASKPEPQAETASTPIPSLQALDGDDAVVEWEEVQAHMPYIDKKTEHLGSKSKLELQKFSNVNCGKRYPHGSGYSSVELLDPVVGDYGHIKAQYVNSEEKTKRVHMYYSLVAERIEKFVEIASLVHEAARGTDRNVLVVDVHLQYLADMRDQKRLGQDPPMAEVRQRIEQQQEVSFFITRELGPLLGAHLTQFKDQRLPLRDAAIYVHSSLEALRSLHKVGIVHRDVSPWAFVLEVDRPHSLLMTNLSLARKIYDSETNTFIPRRPRVNFFGTLPFASRAAHAREERSFSDDIESWFYTICHLLWPGDTSWHNLLYDQAKDPAEKDKLHAEFAKSKDDFLRSMATESTGLFRAPDPIFSSIANQILKSRFETQTEEFAPELAAKLKAYAKEVPAAIKENQPPPRELPPLRPRCLTDQYLHGRRKH